MLDLTPVCCMSAHSTLKEKLQQALGDAERVSKEHDKTAADLASKMKDCETLATSLRHRTKVKSARPHIEHFLPVRLLWETCAEF